MQLIAGPKHVPGGDVILQPGTYLENSTEPGVAMAWKGVTAGQTQPRTRLQLESLLALSYSSTMPPWKEFVFKSRKVQLHGVCQVLEQWANGDTKGSGCWLQTC